MFKKIIYNIFDDPMQREKGLRGTSSGKLYIDKKVFYKRPEVKSTIKNIEKSIGNINKETTKIIMDNIKELNGLMRIADNYRGVHKKVESDGIYSGNAIRMHKSGKQILADEEKIKKLIDSYKNHISEVQEKIYNINVKL